jgi:UMP-CMP kinase
MIDQMIRDGEIVPAHVTVALLKRQMEANKETPVFLIDGFPRAVEQFEFFKASVNPGWFMLFLECPEEVLVTRLLRRGASSGRSDDNPDSIRKRLRTFNESTLAVRQLFEAEGRLEPVVADADMDTVAASVHAVFKRREPRLAEYLDN